MPRKSVVQAQPDQEADGKEVFEASSNESHRQQHSELSRANVQ